MFKNKQILLTIEDAILDVLIFWNSEGNQLVLPKFCLGNLNCFPLLSCAAGPWNCHSSKLIFFFILLYFLFVHLFIYFFSSPELCSGWAIVITFCPSSMHPSEHFQTTSPLKPPSQFCSDFIWSLLRLGERKIAKMVAVHWLRWQPCSYMVKSFKNRLQNWGCLGAESLYKSSGTGGQPKLLKWWSYMDVWPFYSEVKFASLCICMGPIHLYGKNVENFKRLFLWSPWASVAQISCVASLGQGNERLLK